MLSKIVGFGRKVARTCRMLRDRAGQISFVDWIKGVIVLAILGVGVAIPIVVNTIQSISVNDTMTSLILGFLPPILAVAVLLGFLGR